MLLDIKWANFVVHYETAFGNKMWWLKMENLPVGPLGILNIYAPIKSIETNKLWEYLKMKLLKNWKWIYSMQWFQHGGRAN